MRTDLCRREEIPAFFMRERKQNKTSLLTKTVSVVKMKISIVKIEKMNSAEVPMASSKE